jgi:hypothetical protein
MSLSADKLITLGCQFRGITPRPAVASDSRSEVPSVSTTWAWWSRRSMVAADLGTDKAQLERLREDKASRRAGSSTGSCWP